MLWSEFVIGGESGLLSNSESRIERLWLHGSCSCSLSLRDYRSQHTSILREPLPDHTVNTENPAPTACRHRGLGGSGVYFRAMQLHAVGARARSRERQRG